MNYTTLKGLQHGTQFSFELNILNGKAYFANDGITNSARVTGTSTRKLYKAVVDQVLNSPTVASRFVSQGTPFEGATEDVTYDVTSDTSGQFITGLETLNSSASNTTATGSFGHTIFTQPVVSIMAESFANMGNSNRIPLDDFKYEKGAAQVLQAMGTAFYQGGNSAQPLGLLAIVDDGTNIGTIGGLSRTTYAVLDSTLTAYGSGKLTLATMATQYDTAIASGLSAETPNIGYTTKTIWSLYEQLLSPNVRVSYDEVGYSVGLRNKYADRGRQVLQNGAGFNALGYRDMAIIRDDFATAQMLWMVNESYINWMGRTEVPAAYKDILEKVDLGTGQGSYEGTGAMALKLPSEFNGFFYQKPLMIPEQAGRIARFYVIGQLVPKSFRRHAKGTGITGV